MILLEERLKNEDPRNILREKILENLNSNVYGEKLKILRESLQMSICEMVSELQKENISINSSVVGEIENGMRIITKEGFERIRDILFKSNVSESKPQKSFEEIKKIFMSIDRPEIINMIPNDNKFEDKVLNIIRKCYTEHEVLRDVIIATKNWKTCEIDIYVPDNLIVEVKNTNWDVFSRVNKRIARSLIPLAKELSTNFVFCFNGDLNFHTSTSLKRMGIIPLDGNRLRLIDRDPNYLKMLIGDQKEFETNNLVKNLSVLSFEKIYDLKKFQELTGLSLNMLYHLTGESQIRYCYAKKAIENKVRQKLLELRDKIIQTNLRDYYRRFFLGKKSTSNNILSEKVINKININRENLVLSSISNIFSSYGYRSDYNVLMTDGWARDLIEVDMLASNDSKEVIIYYKENIRHFLQLYLRELSYIRDFLKSRVILITSQKKVPRHEALECIYNIPIICIKDKSQEEIKNLLENKLFN